MGTKNKDLVKNALVGSGLGIAIQKLSERFLPGDYFGVPMSTLTNAFAGIGLGAAAVLTKRYTLPLAIASSNLLVSEGVKHLMALIQQPAPASVSVRNLAEPVTNGNNRTTLRPPYAGYAEISGPANVNKLGTYASNTYKMGATSELISLD